MGIYLASSPGFLTEGQITSRPARPNSSSRVIEENRLFLYVSVDTNLSSPPPPSSSSETEETFSKAASKQAHVGTCAAKLQTQDQLSSKASALDSFPLGRFALCAA